MHGVDLEQRLAEIDDEIRRLHAGAIPVRDDEFARLVAAAQIDELLEQRHKLTRQPTPDAR